MEDVKTKAQLLQSIHFHRTTLIDLTVIAFIGLISISWFGGNYLIKTGDDFFPLDPAYTYSYTSYLWLHFISEGAILSPLGLTNLPFSASIALLNAVGFSLIALQKTFYYIAFTLSGISAYFLTTSLLRKNRRVAGFASALFYMMNPYSLSVVWWAHYTTLFFTYSIAPLLLTLYIRGINAKEKGWYVIAMGIIQLIASAMFFDPSDALVTLFLIPTLFFIFYVFTERKDRTNIINVLRFSLLLEAFLFAVSSWWILPTVYFGHVQYELATSAYSSADVFISGSTFSTMLNTLRLLGYYFIWAKWYPVSVYAWTETYSSPAFGFMSCLIPIFAFASLIFKPWDRYTIFFALLSVLGLFLSKGGAEPFGSINMWLFYNIPFAAIFRTNFVRFGSMLVLGYTFLIGVTFSELWNRLKKTRLTPMYLTNLRAYNFKMKRSPKSIAIATVLLVTIVLFAVYNYPFWTGDVIYPGSPYLPSARIQVPSYYIDAGNYINIQPEEFRILDIPPRIGGTSAYSWEHGYIASDAIDQYYLHKPLVGIGLISPLDQQVFDLISNNQSSSSIVNLLSLMNIKYILVHRDWNSSLIGWYSPSSEVASEVLNHKEGIYLEKSFEKLDLYRNGYWEPLHLYATPNAVLVQGGLNEMVWVIEREDFTPGDSVLFLSDQNDLQRLSNSHAQMIKYEPKNLVLRVYDGWTNPINWSSTFVNGSYIARYFAGWKGIISTRGIGNPDMFVFPSLDKCPYAYALDGSGGRSAYDSTLIYIFTGNKPLKIYSVSTDSKPAIDIPRIFLETDVVGTPNKPIIFPIVIPEYQKAIIQINHKADKVVLNIEPPEFTVPSGAKGPVISYEEINPTKYVAHVIDASQPFFLVFSESYQKDWIAYVNGEQLPDDQHFMANGYANAWYIRKTDSFDVVLEFWPQKLFYIGATISLPTFILCTLYLGENRIKTFYYRCLKKNTAHKLR